MRLRRPVPIGAIAAVGVLALALASCGSATSTTEVAAVPAGLPPAQALAGPGGSWATLAMGHLGDPLNTFGELVYRPGCPVGTGASCNAPVDGPWVLATPPGVATNGGLMMAVDRTGGVTAGFGVSLDLRFSPLAATSDAGSVWSGGILPTALAPTPDALAATSAGRRLALGAPTPVGNGAVLASASDLSTWTTVATRAAVGSAASRAGCALTGLSGVAITASGVDLAAGDCADSRRAGIFTVGRDGRPVPVTMVGPPVATSPVGGVRVLRLVTTATGVVALVATGPSARARIEVLSSPDGVTGWSVSTAFSGRGTVESTAVSGAGGFVVLLRTAGGAASAAAIDPGTPWRVLPVPPRGTAVVAPAAAGVPFEALVPSGSSLGIDRLGPTGWTNVQRLAVPIQYGSTSGGGAG